MQLRLSGTVRVRTTDFASRYVGAVQRELIGALIEQKVGTIREEVGRISFRRGFFGSSNRGVFSTFDPGEISLHANGTAMLVRYRLGLSYYLGALGLIGFGIALLFVLRDQLKPWMLPGLGSVIVILNSWKFATSLRDVRRWLKATAEAGIRNHVLAGT